MALAPHSPPGTARAASPSSSSHRAGRGWQAVSASAGLLASVAPAYQIMPETIGFSDVPLVLILRLSRASAQVETLSSVSGSTPVKTPERSNTHTRFSVTTFPVSPGARGSPRARRRRHRPRPPRSPKPPSTSRRLGHGFLARERLRPGSRETASVKWRRAAVHAPDWPGRLFHVASV